MQEVTETAAIPSNGKKHLPKMYRSVGMAVPKLQKYSTDQSAKPSAL